jgi:hypothetical protein
MGWIVEQRDPAGEWFTRATMGDCERKDAEDRAHLFKEHNPKLRFRYGHVDEDDEHLDESKAIEV